MKILNITFVFSLFISVAAWAGGAGGFKGNGGDVVVCSDRPIQVLDLYEANFLRTVKPNLGAANLTVDQKVEIYLAALSRFAPVRAKMLRDGIVRFANQTNFISGVSIEDIPDSDQSFIIPANCKIMQIANRNPLLLPPGKTFAIDQALWDQLDNDNKVVLMFHELIYEESTAKTSKAIRYLNSSIATNEVQTWAQKDFFNALQAAGLKWFEWNGFQLDLSQEVNFFRDTANLILAYAVDQSDYLFQGQTIKLKNEMVRFFENGAPQSFSFYGTIPLTINDRQYNFQMDAENHDPAQAIHVTPNNQIDLDLGKYTNLLYIHNYLSLYENGAVASGPLSDQNRPRWTTQQFDLTYGYVEFSPNGSITLVAKVQGNVQVAGMSLPVDYSTPVVFDEQERVIRFDLANDIKGFPIQNTKIDLFGNSSLVLDRRGQVRQLTLASSARLLTTSGTEKVFKQWETIKLDEKQKAIYPPRKSKLVDMLN